MADQQSLSSVLSELSLSDLQVDSDGKVRIANPDVAKRVADLAGGPSGRALSDSLNTGTCHNTYCIAPGLDQLAARGNPALR
ncbi:hypothetical protein [Rhodopseudomonas palustris]